MKEKNGQRQNDHKILSLDQYRHHFAEDNSGADEKSVHQLLQHMRRMREAVPVNYQLQEELRKKLLAKQRNVPKPELPVPKVSNSGSMLKGRWIALLIVLLMVVVFLIVNKSQHYSLQSVGMPKEVVTLWNADSNLSFAVVPNEGVLIARHGQLLLSDSSVGQYRVLDAANSWLYNYPAVSPNGDKVALVRQRQGAVPQIVAISMSELKNVNQELDANGFTVLRSANHQQQFADLAWSPDGSQLAYTVINKQGKTEVWVLEGQDNRFLAKGIKPTWSPDGTELVIQRQINENKTVLVLIDVKTGTEKFLGEGEQPIWGSNGYLAFVSTSQQERVLTFMPDGTPQFTIRQRVGEIRSIFAGSNGQRLLEQLDHDKNWLALSTLLVSPDKGTGDREIDWLRQMELQGVREPRVLMLDEVEKCHNPAFGMEGKMLFYARQDQGKTTILQVDIEERPIDRGVK
ncbi:hypothetical protein V6C27_07245 [Peptococcaceae bacterium 1198_IL3148]